jgi:hypothetical protein
LGSRSQRGQTQLSLDLLYRSLGTQTLHPSNHPSLIASLSATDASESQILSATDFLDSVYGDGLQERVGSRAPTPMVVGRIPNSLATTSIPPGLYGQSSFLECETAISARGAEHPNIEPTLFACSQYGFFKSSKQMTLPSQLPFWNTERLTRSQAKFRFGINLQDPTFIPATPKRSAPQRPSALPQFPDISDLFVATNPNAEYAILVSMYEVYNDRIYDLLSYPRNPKDQRRRPLLFKSTELSPDRKLVAGLRKVVCGSYDEALMVLETGLMERRVAGTGSNSVSSRSHGFFCVEAKRRLKGGISTSWSGSQLTIVDLAGKHEKFSLRR